MQILARLGGWYHLQRLSLHIHNPRKSKSAAALRIWYCDTHITELQQLKGHPSTAAAATDTPSTSSSSSPSWKLAVPCVRLSPCQSDVSVDLPVPLLLCAVLVEFVAFHVSVAESAQEVLHCPRCSHVVTDKHGLCGYCR